MLENRFRCISFPAVTTRMISCFWFFLAIWVFDLYQASFSWLAPWQKHTSKIYIYTYIYGSILIIPRTVISLFPPGSPVLPNFGFLGSKESFMWIFPKTNSLFDLGRPGFLFTYIPRNYGFPEMMVRKRWLTFFYMAIFDIYLRFSGALCVFFKGEVAQIPQSNTDC